MGVLRKYKIGDCVKCTRPSIFNSNIYIILNIGINTMDEVTYILDKAPNYGKEIHHSYLYQDDECFKMQRKLKLDKINKNENG